VDEKLLCAVGKQAVKAYARLSLKLDIEYRADMPAGAKIITPNHPTTIDPFLMPLLMAEPAHILVTESAFKVPLLGAYLRRAGHIEVRAGQGQAALEAARTLLHQGETIVIFPEGALSPLGGGFQKAHTGAARLALMTGAPIIPVGIALDVGRITFRQTDIKAADGSAEVVRLYSGGPYTVTVGEAMRLQGDVEDRALVRAQVDRMMQQIRRLSRHSQYRMQSGERLPLRETGEFQRAVGE
jgi:1-acyl-sn-glycerol-3-phosphate acyltransferase